MSGFNDLNCVPDYDSRDHDERDYQTDTGGGFSFAKFIFERLPVYFKINDTYKNRLGEGLLERYLSNFGYELDFEVMPQISCYLNIIDASVTPSKFLNHLSDVLGNPPDVFKNEEIYRNLLAYIVSINKIKGTKKSYELFFSILGFDIELTEIEPVTELNFYDTGGAYDTGIKYDINECEPCSYYDIIFYPKNTSDTSLTVDTLRRLRLAIEYNEPINAKLRNLTFGIKIQDELAIDIVDTTTEQEEQTLRYDYENLYDDGNQYDDPSLIPVLIEERNMVIYCNNIGYNRYNIKMDIQNLNGITINPTTTQLKIRAFDNLGDLIYQVNGVLIDGQLTLPDNFEANIISSEHYIDGLVSLQLSGRILLTDNKEAKLDININRTTGALTTLYFK